MAAGTNPTDTTTINQAATAQATYLGDMYATVKRYLIQWQVNAGSVSTLVAVGYTDASSQAQVLQLQSNLNTLVNVFEGNTSASYTPHSMISDLASLRGVNG